MEIKQYAPVIIPTLNRYDSFKRCLESLEKCTGADMTEVHIALDYPPSDKYVDGWKKIDRYLAEKENQNGFKSLIVYRRKENYYFSGKGNATSIINELSKTQDRYILSEDDNEFSPCFLEFMNWGLERYKDKPNIISICGYNEIPIDNYNQNIFIDTWYSSWGVGHWVKKWDQLIATVANEDYSRRFLRDMPITTIFKRDIWLASTIVSSVTSKTYYWDSLPYRFKSYPLLTIHPTISMVRNWGQDGSGQHGYDMDRHRKQMINPFQMEPDFYPSTENLIEEANLIGISDKYFKIPLRNRVYETINFISYKIMRKDASWMIKIYKKYIKRWLKK